MNISIPQNVSEIGNYSFIHCKKLITVNFHPDSKLKVINFGAFSSSSIYSADSMLEYEIIRLFIV